MVTLEAGTYHAPKHRTLEEQETLDKYKIQFNNLALRDAELTRRKREKDFYIIMELRAQRTIR